MVMLAPDPSTFTCVGATMPKAYEDMRDKFKREGLSDKAAKEKAAKIYNSQHPKSPVTGKHHSTKRK